jgi:uncharacterized membrane protein
MILKEIIKKLKMKIRSNYSILFILAVVVVVFVINSCSESNSRKKIKQTEENVYHIWSDTIVKMRYDNGDIMKVWGYKPDDTLMHYEWMYYQTGYLWLEGPFYGDLRHGKWKAYNEEGILVSQAVYKMGKEEGVKTVWYGNEMKFYEGIMKEGKRIGKWQFYNRDGDLIKEIDYSKN